MKKKRNTPNFFDSPSSSIEKFIKISREVKRSDKKLVRLINEAIATSKTQLKVLENMLKSA